MVDKISRCVDELRGIKAAEHKTEGKKSVRGNDFGGKYRSEKDWMGKI